MVGRHLRRYLLVALIVLIAQFVRPRRRDLFGH